MTKNNKSKAEQDFKIDSDRLSAIEVKTGEEVQKFNGTWYRGKNINFIPSKKILSKPNALEKFVFRGQLPSKPFIQKDTVVTAFGSCFAANISKWLLGNGYNVLGKKINLNSHIIRFGEGMVNTFAILEQLEWALENKSLEEGLWFGEKKEVVIPSEEIQKNTRDLLVKSKVLILTIGLSEIWYDKFTGRAFWRAIPADLFDNSRHGFRVSTVEENTQNLMSIVALCQRHMPDCKIIFTLSPIPLMATFRDISCISANTVSKAILRVALDNLQYENNEKLFYFPSYELVKEAFTDPFLEDNRHIKPELIKIIMAQFAKHYCL